jgi:uncharacterized protein YecE (DUF72 family)
VAHVRSRTGLAPPARQENVRLHPDEVYVCLHGPKRWYRHEYSKEELAEWTDRIEASGAKRAWIYFNKRGPCAEKRYCLPAHVERLCCPLCKTGNKISPPEEDYDNHGERQALISTANMP